MKSRREEGRLPVWLLLVPKRRYKGLIEEALWPREASFRHRRYQDEHKPLHRLDSLLHSPINVRPLEELEKEKLRSVSCK